MYPQPIEHYYAPRTLAEALDLIERHGAGAAILAGGQSLLQQLKARLSAPRTLIDINRVSGLDHIGVRGGRFEIGALVRFATAARHAELRRDYTALAEAAAAIGDRQVRNRGTLAGSIAFRANYGDIAPAAAALDSSLIFGAPERADATGDEHTMALEAFVGSAGNQPARLITAISLPLAAAATGSCYLKHGRVSQDRATLGLAVWMARDAAERCQALRIAIGGLGSGPVVRAKAVEAALAGARIDAGILREAGRIAAATIETQTDELAAADYRRQLLAVYLPRAIELAWARTAERPR